MHCGLWNMDHASWITRATFFEIAVCNINWTLWFVCSLVTRYLIRGWSPGTKYSAAQIYPNQNIRVIRVSPIRVYAYAYTQIRLYIVVGRWSILIESWSKSSSDATIDFAFFIIDCRRKIKNLLGTNKSSIKINKNVRLISCVSCLFSWTPNF